MTVDRADSFVQQRTDKDIIDGAAGLMQDGGSTTVGQQMTTKNDTLAGGSNASVQRPTESFWRVFQGLRASTLAAGQQGDARSSEVGNTNEEPEIIRNPTGRLCELDKCLDAVIVAP